MSNRSKKCYNYQEQKKEFLDELYDEIWMIDDLLIYLECLTEENNDNWFLEHIRRKYELKLLLLLDRAFPSK